MGFDFEAVDALDYDELRPTYATESVRWVADRARLVPGSTVVDLAAGTGQLTRRFSERGCHVIAVEPAANMRSVLQANAPEVTALAGTAEAIPVPDGDADAVVVGNAFHHFEPDRASREIRRVLRQNGALALFWARADQEDRSMMNQIKREIDRIVEQVRPSSDFIDAYVSWYEPQAVEGFTPFERRSFPTTHVIPSSRVADLYATSSDIASLQPNVRSDLLGRITGLATGLPETLELAERSEVHFAVRA